MGRARLEYDQLPRSETLQIKRPRGKLVESGLAVSPDSDRLSVLQIRLAKEREHLVAELTSKAEICLRANKLTTPVDDCAYKYYLQLGEFSGNRHLVRAGMRNIGNRYALLAENAFQRFDFEKARHYVSEGIGVDPDNTRLQVLERELLKSKPEMIMKGVERKLKSLF